jgi:probable rRNA maturation factor
MKVYIYSASLVEKLYIKKVLKIASKMLNHPKNAEVYVSIVDEEEIRSLNAEKRGIDSVTDVLSFPLYDLSPEKPIEKSVQNIEDMPFSLGDIIICRKRAKEQAIAYGHTYKREVCFLALHGYLHLVGYNHETKEEAEIMESTQEKILIKAGIKR